MSFDEHNPLGDEVPGAEVTATGLRPNPWSVGPALVWSAVVVPGHQALREAQRWGSPWAANGYTWPYQVLVGGTTLAAAWLGLGLIYGICRHFARPLRAAFAAALLTLGTTMVYYNSIEVSMGHALGTTAVAALVWYWLKTYGLEQMGRWVLVGVLVGVAALMRWQSAAFAVLPLGEALGRSLGAGPRQLAGRLLAGLSLAALGAVLAFLPQMAAWRCVYGSWLISPVPLEHHWLKPDFWGVLGSTDRSLWYWTPLTLLALAGFLHLGRPGPSSVRFPAGLLLMVFVVQVYLLASIRGNGVRLGSAFGFRQLTETLVALAPGLALLLERAGTRSFRWLAGGGCLLVAWNFVLLFQYRQGLLPRDGGAGFAQLLENAGVLA